jgi:hypothetical protein
MNHTTAASPGSSSAGWKWTVRIGVVLAVLLAGGLLLALWARHDPLRAEYPDAPFPHVPDNYPLILPLDIEEPSPTDLNAYFLYKVGLHLVRQYLREKGVLSRVSPEERDAYELAVDKDQFVRARELALRALKDHPDSIPARFALVVVEELGEGNFPRALLQIRSLRHALYRRGLENPHDEQAREWFLLVLEQEASILHALSRSEEELRVNDVLEQMYRSRPWRRIAPLIKLRRFDEARRFCQQAEKMGGMKRELRALRMSLARLEGRRKDRYDLALQAVAAVGDSCFEWKNLAEAARDDFRFQEAYDAAEKAAGFALDYRGSPYRLLCTSYLDQCRPLEAWDALKKYQEQRRLRPPYTLQFDQNELDATAARMFLALGRCESAVHFARRRAERPQRLAYTDDDSRSETFSADLGLLEALRNRLEQLREEAAGGAIEADFESESAAALQMQCWALEKRLLHPLGDEDFLVARLRPPTADAALDLLPGRVAAEALRRAREKEKHPSAAPYFDAMEAELAWNQGHYEQTLALARKAFAGLPVDFQRHLRARVAVVAGDAAWRLGRGDEMLPLFDQALGDCPAVFRMCRVAIPIAVADDGSRLAQALGRRLLASPRFRADAAGFPVALRTTGRQLTFELFRLRKIRHCADGVTIEGAPSEVVASAYRRFHEGLMSPLLALKPIDINFLEDCLFAAPPGDRIDATIRLLKPQ